MKKISQIMPYVDKKEIEAIKTTIDTKWLTEGPYAKRFLEHIKQFTGAKYAVLVPNGTLGLFLALLALDLPKDSEVIVPSFTFMASASVVVFAGLKPVFVDVDPNTWNIDTKLLEDAITINTLAIMPVHIYGHSADMDGVTRIAKKHGLKIIEDAAQGYGVRYKKKHVGTFGDISMISFFADKTITMGEGGVVLTNNDFLFEKLKLLRNQGRPNSGTFIHPSLGMNFRLTDIQCAVGCTQAEKFPEILEDRLNKYNMYLNQLQNVGDFKFLSIQKESTLVPFRFYLRTKHKDALIQYLESKDIQTRSFFYPLHKQPCMKDYTMPKQLPISEELYKTGICLPIHYYLTNDDITFICSEIKKFFKTVSR